MRKDVEGLTVAEKRKYMVLDVDAAKKIALVWLQNARLENSTEFGLPEVDDRYHIWRVPLINKAMKDKIGEVVIDARTSLILQSKTTSVENLEARLLGREENIITSPKPHNKKAYQLSAIRNTIALSDSEEVLQSFFNISK